MALITSSSVVGGDEVVAGAIGAAAGVEEAEGLTEGGV